MKRTLTVRSIEALKPAEKRLEVWDAVVPGLTVRVMPSGVKSFNLVARFPGSSNPTRRTIGKVGAIDLAKARDKARNWLDLIARGIDPAEQLEREKAENDRRRRDTIAALAEAYLARRVIGKMRQEARTVHNFRDILIPLFGHRPVVELTAKEVSIALGEIEDHGTDHALVKLGVRKQLRRPGLKPSPCPTQARNLFVFLDGALRWAAGTGDYGIDESPLKRVSKADRFGKAPKRDRVLSDDEIGCVWRASGTLRTPYRQLYRMLLLTGLRLSEVLEAEWGEFDLKLKKWTIPAARMKGKDGTVQKHTVPLIDCMLDVLKELRRGMRGPFVFSVNDGASSIANRGKFKVMLDEAIAAELRMHESKTFRFVNHDFRRALASHAVDLGIEAIVVEKMLAHTLPGVVGIYNRNDYFEQRRAAHEKWSAFLLDCERKANKVTALRGRAAAVPR